MDEYNELSDYNTYDSEPMKKLLTEAGFTLVNIESKYEFIGV